MSKVIESPVKRFPGSVSLPDFLTFPQAIAWEDAVTQARAIDQSANYARFLEAYLPGFRAVVETWNLDGFDIECPPATPRASVISLIAWLVGAISEMYREAEDVPNG